jgi:hypothetical protein
MNNTTWNDSRFGPGSYEHASQEDRSAPRVRVHITATLRLSGARPFETIVRDLSLGGFTASAPKRLEEHTMCWLTIPGFPAIKGEVVWWEAGVAGIAFAVLLERDAFGAIVDQHRNAGTEFDS